MDPRDVQRPGPGLGRLADFAATVPSAALEDDGAHIVALLENSPDKLPTLRERFPGARIYEDYSDGEWAGFAFWPQQAIRLLTGGPPCQDVAPTGRRRGFRGRNAAAVIGFAILARESGADFVCLENVTAFATTGALAVIAAILAAPIARKGQRVYRLVLPPGIDGFEVHRSHEHGAPVNRTRLVAWFEDVNLTLPALPQSAAVL